VTAVPAWLTFGLVVPAPVLTATASSATVVSILALTESHDVMAARHSGLDTERLCQWHTALFPAGFLACIANFNTPGSPGPDQTGRAWKLA